MLAEVVDLLRCPVCGSDLGRGEGTLRCAGGHCFDIASQGYVSLFAGAGRTRDTDTPEMVEARATFLGAGHYRWLSEALAEEARAITAAPEAVAGDAGKPPLTCVVDVGAGTGHHLAAVLDALPAFRGLAIDASSASLRRAARAHPRAAAIGADAWKPLPVRDDVAGVLLSVFAPRSAAELSRILAQGGALLAVTPTTRHLYELVGPLGLLSVPDDKEDRLDAQLGSHFTLAGRRTIERAMFLSRHEAAQLVRIGPSAWHVDEQSVAERLAVLPDPVSVTASVTLSSFALS